PPGTETTASTADSTASPESGVPAEAASGTSTSLATIPTAAGTTPAFTASTPAPAAKPAPTPTQAPATGAPAAKAPEPVSSGPTSNGANIAGKWTGTWVGTGLFNAPRQENVTLELAQKGEAGYGRLVLDGATAAESVPWEVRQQGLGGIRVFAS